MPDLLALDGRTNGVQEGAEQLLRPGMELAGVAACRHDMLELVANLCTGLGTRSGQQVADDREQLRTVRPEPVDRCIHCIRVQGRR
jgi:hypothetical protein